MAVAHPPVGGVSRIGPVYTPPDARGRGYGSAATAAASRDILDAGDVACLYTDLANPTSNKIYRRSATAAVLDRAHGALRLTRPRRASSANASNEYGRPRKRPTRSAASREPPGASTSSR